MRDREANVAINQSLMKALYANLDPHEDEEIVPCLGVNLVWPASLLWKKWHPDLEIDHVVPLALFDVTSLRDRMAAWSMHNLAWLPSSINRRKRDQWPWAPRNMRTDGRAVWAKWEQSWPHLARSYKSKLNHALRMWGADGPLDPRWVERPLGYFGEDPTDPALRKIVEEGFLQAGGLHRRMEAVVELSGQVV